MTPPANCPSCGEPVVTADALGGPTTCPNCGGSLRPPAGPAATSGPPSAKIGVWVDGSRPRPLSTLAGPEPTRGEPTPLDRIVAHEFDKLKRARHLLVDMEAQAQAQIVARQLELGQREAGLAAAGGDLTVRAAAVAAAEQALAAREQAFARLTAGLAEREAAAAALEANRAALEAEVLDLGRLAADLGPLVERFRARRDEEAATRAALAADRASLDRRVAEVGRIEAGLQARLAELDGMERAIRSPDQTPAPVGRLGAVGRGA